MPLQTAQQARYVTQQHEATCTHTAKTMSDMSRKSELRHDGLEQTAAYTNAACILVKTSSLFQPPLTLFQFHCGICTVHAKDRQHHSCHCQ